MATYEAKDEQTGKTVTFEWHDETPPTEQDMEEVFTAASQTKQSGATRSWEPEPTTPLTSIPGKALSNLPKSALEFGRAMIQPIVHPLDTINSIGDMIEGATRGSLVEGWKPTLQRDVENKKKAEAFAQALNERYGGYENVKKTIATDPVGSLGDVSTLLTGGGSLAARAPGMVGRIGNAVKTAGAVTEPLSLAGRVVAPVAKVTGNTLAGLTGFTSGAGKESVIKAYQAGRESIPEFAGAMRGKVTGDELRATAKSSLQAIKDDRAADYQARLANISTNMQELDPSPMRDRMAQLEAMYKIKRKKVVDPETGMELPDELDFSRSTLDRKSIGDVENIIREVDNWGTQPGDFTPVGMDILHRKLNDFYAESKNGRGFVKSLENVVKDTVSTQVPEYKTMLENYSKSTSQINEIENALSLGTRSGADTGIRKLLTALKDNNEFRGSLIKVLDEANNGELAAKIAGYNLSSVTPTNFIGKGMEIGAITSLFAGVSPKIAIALTMASPRVVGEFVYKLGGVVKQYEAMGKLFPAGTRNTLYQTGRATSPQPPQSAPPISQ